MNINADKAQENKNETDSTEKSQLSSGGKWSVQFTDNRPEAGIQRNVTEMMGSSSRSKQIAQLQQMADKHATQPAFSEPLKPNETGLPDELKSGIEHLSGYSMDDVKVHYHSDKPAQLQAYAFAQGTDIHVASGQEEHLPHEAWHVVQQKQGRVKSTLQMKGGIAVNDDAELEQEATEMGAKAAQLKPLDNWETRMNLNPSQQVFSDNNPLQAKFNRLSEARIEKIQKARKEDGEEVEGDFLEGLYEKNVSTVNDSGNPNLYYKVISVTKAVMNRVVDPRSKDTLATNMIPLFANIKSEKWAKDRDKLLQDDLELWDINENGPYTVKQVADAQQSLIGKGTAAADKFKNDVIGSLLTGGVIEEESGEYGAIEFRFAHESGDMYVLESVEEDMREVLASIDPKNKHPKMRVIGESSSALQRYKHCYLAAKLPYPDLRIGQYYLFIEDSVENRFIKALLDFHTSQGIQDRSSKLTAGKAGNPVKKLPDAPLADNKTRFKSYQASAKRGSRDAGQKAVMNNYSAEEYVRVFNAKEANDKSWEWLHIQGARLGGANIPQNLVAGTSEANSHMIPYERAIHQLSKFSGPQLPINITWTASLIKDGDGLNTHISDSITISVEMDEMPDMQDENNLEDLLGIFPITFNPIEGAQFTKFDRDTVKTRSE
ncbi:DUF4157 domain-containing protein [Fluviicola sp.]|uniref:eCIS core domain-containing protein n=1 Tax=Fluviicola sp. TaxID=1917219 RepID=UPI0031DD0179